MASTSKKVLVSDEVVHGLWQENECSHISRSEYSSNSEINVKILFMLQSVF
jgi:hypothetical protein